MIILPQTGTNTSQSKNRWRLPERIPQGDTEMVRSLIMISHTETHCILRLLPRAGFQKIPRRARRNSDLHKARWCTHCTHPSLKDTRGQRHSQEILIGCRQPDACLWPISMCAHTHTESDRPVISHTKGQLPQRNALGHQLRNSFKVFTHCYGYFLSKAKTQVNGT